MLLESGAVMSSFDIGHHLLALQPAISIALRHSQRPSKVLFAPVA